MMSSIKSKQISDSPEEPKSKKKKVKNIEGNAQDGFELGKNRKLSVSLYKGKKLVNIREFYESGGEMKPGKKGIALTLDQWEKVLEVQEEINAVLKP